MTAANRPPRSAHIASLGTRLTLLSVLDELDTDTLADGRVGLLGLDSNLLKDDTLGVGRSTGRGRAVGGSEGALLVVVVGLVGAKTRASESAILVERGGGHAAVRRRDSCALTPELHARRFSSCPCPRAGARAQSSMLALHPPIRTASSTRLRRASSQIGRASCRERVS